MFNGPPRSSLSTYRVEDECIISFTNLLSSGPCQQEIIALLS